MKKNKKNKKTQVLEEERLERAEVWKGGGRAHELLTLAAFFFWEFEFEFAEIAPGILKTSFPVDDGEV